MINLHGASSPGFHARINSTCNLHRSDRRIFVLVEFVGHLLTFINALRLSKVFKIYIYISRLIELASPLNSLYVSTIPKRVSQSLLIVQDSYLEASIIHNESSSSRISIELLIRNRT